MSLFLCCVRAPFKLALLNWMPLDKSVRGRTSVFVTRLGRLVITSSTSVLLDFVVLVALATTCFKFSDSRISLYRLTSDVCCLIISMFTSPAKICPSHEATSSLGRSSSLCNLACVQTSPISFAARGKGTSV